MKPINSQYMHLSIILCSTFMCLAPSIEEIARVERKVNNSSLVIEAAYMDQQTLEAAVKEAETFMMGSEQDDQLPFSKVINTLDIYEYGAGEATGLAANPSIAIRATLTHFKRKPGRFKEVVIELTEDSYRMDFVGAERPANANQHNSKTPATMQNQETTHTNNQTQSKPSQTTQHSQTIGTNKLTINNGINMSNFELDGILSTIPGWAQTPDIKPMITNIKTHLKDLDPTTLNGLEKTIYLALNNCSTLVPHKVGCSHGFNGFKCEHPALFIYIIQQHLQNNPDLNVEIDFTIDSKKVSMNVRIPDAKSSSTDSSYFTTQLSKIKKHPFIVTAIVGISCIAAYYWYNKNSKNNEEIAEDHNSIA